MQKDFMQQHLPKDYVIPFIAGGLGNNLFMIANAYARAMDGGKELYLYRKHVDYRDNYPENILRKFNFIDEMPESKNINPVTLSDLEPNLFSGYFQNEKYFNKYSEDIKLLFGPPTEFVNRMRSELPILFTDDVVAINVRKGDYLYYKDYHPTVSVEYIHKALEKVPARHYIIASDDIPWCKENIVLSNCTFIEGYTTYEQLWILSLCKHFVISNSTFSWWGAYLSLHKDKIVVSPETWFGPEFKGSWENIYCKGWIKLPTYFDDGLIMPR